MPSKNPTPDVSSKYGAPMGRAGERGGFSLEGGQYYLRRIYLNSGAYDAGGAYWGLGAPVFYWESPSGASGYVRARSRALAKVEVLKDRPNATFLR